MSYPSGNYYDGEFYMDMFWLNALHQSFTFID